MVLVCALCVPKQINPYFVKIAEREKKKKCSGCRKKKTCIDIPSRNAIDWMDLEEQIKFQKPRQKAKIPLHLQKKPMIPLNIKVNEDIIKSNKVKR